MAGLEDLWPQRLLDTSTSPMRSVKRLEGNTYDGVLKPKYNILSYTWGRYEVSNGMQSKVTPRLNVSGTTWAIPAICEGCAFSAAAFERVLRRISPPPTTKGHRFVWVDVACIDQENYADKMAEIGRQAGIFANAEDAFVWLWTVSTPALSRSLGEMTRFWPRQCRLTSPDAPPVSETRESHTHNEAIMMPRLRESVDTILDDPWFSSLWTLQEQGLRLDATLISGECEPVEVEFSLDSEFMDEGLADGEYKSELRQAIVFDLA